MTPVQPLILGFSDDTGVGRRLRHGGPSPTLTGIGQPGATVTIAYVTAAGPQAISAPVSAAGTWSVSLPDLADGGLRLRGAPRRCGRCAVGRLGTPCPDHRHHRARRAVILALADDTGITGDGITRRRDADLERHGRGRRHDQDLLHGRHRTAHPRHRRDGGRLEPRPPDSRGRHLRLHRHRPSTPPAMPGSRASRSPSSSTPRWIRRLPPP